MWKILAEVRKRTATKLNVNGEIRSVSDGIFSF